MISSRKASHCSIVMNQCPFPILAMVFNFRVQNFRTVRFWSSKILEFSRIDLQMRGRNSSKLVYLGTPNSLKKHGIIQKILKCVETTVIVVLGNKNVRGHDFSCCQIYTTSKIFRDNVNFDFLKLYFLKVE